MRLYRTETVCLFLFTILVISGITRPQVVESNISYIDKYNRFILNGEPFFPIGLYVAQCPNESGHVSQLDEIADSPFDTLMNYCTCTCDELGDITDQQITNYLGRLEERNLKLIFSLRLYIGHGQADISDITQKVNTFKGHPAIISWYMNDEFGLEYLTQLEERYQKVRELDDRHPVWSVHWNTEWLLQEAHTTDVVGVDPYPIHGKPDDKITQVSWMADKANESGKPLWLVPQIFSWGDYGKDGRPPTRDEMRAMTYLAINHGAKGLIYYSYFNIRDDKDYKARWPQIKEIASEIDGLRPVLLSTQQTNDNEVICNNSNIDFKLMRQDGAYYLFAVNTKNDTIAGVSFRMNLAHKSAAVKVLFEDDRQRALVHDNFTDNFAPYEVHVYHWKSG